MHGDGKGVSSFFHLVGQALGCQQPRGVLLRRHDLARLGQGRKGRVDAFGVPPAEGMVIAKPQALQRVAIGTQVVLHLLWRGDARQQQYVLACKILGIEGGQTGLLVGIRRCTLPLPRRRVVRGRPLALYEDRHQLQVVNAREVQTLVREQVQCFSEDAKLHGLQVLGTLRDDHHVGPVLATERLAQAACGEQLVVDDESVIIDQQDIDARLHVAVLESVVEKDHIHVLRLRIARHAVDALATVAVDGHIGIGKLPLHLVRLIADLVHGRVGLGQHIATALPLVASGEHAHLHPLLEQPDEILHVRGLARATYGDIAHGDDRYVKSLLAKHAKLKQLVAKTHSQTIDPAQRQQPLIDFDEVALCSQFLRQCCFLYLID